LTILLSDIAQRVLNPWLDAKCSAVGCGSIAK